MKEMIKRIGALFATLAAVLAVGVTAAYAAGMGTITVTPPSETESGVTTTYQLYKVFVAVGNGTGIRYNTVNTGDVVTDAQGNVLTASKGWTLPDCKTAYGSRTPEYSDYTTEHFLFDDTGNVHWGTVVTGQTGTIRTEQGIQVTVYSEAQINDASTGSLPDYALEAIKTYIANDKPIQTVTTTGTTPVSFTNVDNGYYYVTTSTGSAVSVTSANPNATITDKNETPTLTKTITSVTKTGTNTGVGSISSDGKSAIAEQGSTVTYQVVVSFNNGATNVVLHDTLENDKVRLVNQDPTVVFNGGQGSTGASATSRYTTGRQDEGTSTAPDTGDTLTVDFSGISSSVSTATVTYQAVVESGSLTSDAPAVNTAHLTYGTNSPAAATANVSTRVYNARYQVTKLDNANQPLAGAGFVLYRSPNGNTREYYKLDGNTVTWVTVAPDSTTSGEQTYENAARDAVTQGTITQLTTTSGTGGNVVTFSGLADGTYYLYELNVPEGYMRASDVSFTVTSAANTSQDGNGNVIAFTSSNLDQNTTVTNTPGSQLPGTGGYGATLLVVAGAALVAGGALLYVFKVRSAA